MSLFSPTRRKTRRLLSTVAFAGVAVVAATGVSFTAWNLPSQQDWQLRMAQADQPSKGCFTADYPRVAWRSAACAPAPNVPQVPKHGPPPLGLQIGNGNDVSARERPGGVPIRNSIGSFDFVVGVTSESGQIGNAGPSIANAYSLQLNTNYFFTARCAGSPSSDCRGWQQFVFANDGAAGSVFIQYWLIKYNAPCPPGWTPFSFTADTDIYCWRNDPLGALPVPAQPITNLANLKLSGRADGAGDRVTLSVGMFSYSLTGNDALGLGVPGGKWLDAEFNVFGNGGNSGGGGKAEFNAGARLRPRVQIINGYPIPLKPLCNEFGFAGETNNLNFPNSAPPMTGPAPSLVFNEDHVSVPTLFPCNAATAVGDVHVGTVAGTTYDFQATGDFQLAESGPDFEVQERQVSGAPSWPNTSVNQAVGTRMRDTRVVVCAGSVLVVDGKPFQLPDGRSVTLPSGVGISLVGGDYYVTDSSYHTVRITPHSGYMDVLVGIDDWPEDVRGLIGSHNDDPALIEARDGTVFPLPMSFDDLYNRFGNSWRVKSSDSLLTPCGRVAEQGNPKVPFFSADLPTEIRARAKETCVQNRVLDEWLDGCMIDVAMLGPKAATTFVGTAPAVLDGNSRKR
ncbi:hypothetical protein [Actinocrispum wychmicini]|uniref:VWFD domain-containing protein n=1 Tax=Actinocrispum wychmicini TaxID=1213861 RepID=A0A4R2JMY3_9PSEU|nr:hypothetical protein [Actinocrispum wychmicini]TCO60664.1 hypothetical protein EV192_103239 [Actinocrispum wychmicini]